MRTTLRSFCLLAGFALVLGSCSCEDTPPATACTTDQDCPDGQTCVNQVCKGPGADAGDINIVGRDAGQEGVPDIADPNNPWKDTDCDGLSDAEEFANTWGPDAKQTDPGNPDTDGDGIPDGVEAGRTDIVEGSHCASVAFDADPASRTSPVESDSDGDGLADGVEDKNHDGKLDPGETDPMRPDTDGDGLADGVEDENHNGAVDPGETDPAKADTDGDGCPDGYEDKNRNGAVDSGETDPLLAGDCVLGTDDSDGDGLPDAVEVNVTHTDPLKADTDGDGRLDGEEDLDADGVLDPGETDPKSADTDCDGLGDGEEKGFFTDPRLADTDGDGLPDGLEVGRTASPSATCSFVGDAHPASRTFPDRADSDGDGVPDGVEDKNHNGKVDVGETDPANPDSDGDGLSDGAEDANKNGAVDSGETDPTKVDTDSDGIPDGVEVKVTHTDPAKVDTDGDGCRDGEEDRNWNGVKDTGETDPKVAGDCKDSDCDGLRDDEEDKDRDGVVDATETDPNDPDTDGDGLSDGLERGVVLGPSPTVCPGFVGDADASSRTNPLAKDTDCDGLADNEEDANHNGRVDSGETDPAKADTDGDGLPDGLEKGRCTAVESRCAATFVPDADCGATKTDPTRADSDGDGVPDGAEDLNQNGKVDPGELNPGVSDAGGAITQACASPREVQQIDRFASDLTVAAALQFTEVTTLTSGSTAVGAMLYDGTNKIVGFALRVPAKASATAQETDGRAKLAGVEALNSSITQLFTSWDSFDAIEAYYSQKNAGSVDLKARANAVVEAFLPGVTGKLTGTASATGAFRVQAEYLRRNATYSIVVMAFVPESLYSQGDRLFRIDDWANGTALAQFGDVSRPVCEKFSAVAMPKVDFIWVVDNSGSMGQWQAEVANAADQMGTQLASAPIDWRIATIYTDTDRATTRKNTPKPFTRDINVFKTDAQPGAAGASPERSFAPVNAMMQTAWLPATTGAEAPDKLRAGAKVVIVWLTDAKEQTVSGYCDTAGTTCDLTVVPDRDNSYRYLPSGYTSWPGYFANLPGSMGKAFVAAIVPPVGVKMSGEETVGSEYRDVVTALQGLEADMRDKAAMAGFIQQIITSAIGNATLTRLSRPPISASLKVAADQVSGGSCNKDDMARSRTNGFDYDGASKSLVFYGDCRPVANQTVAVSYRTWVEQAPACSPPCSDPYVCDPVSGSCVCPADCGGCGNGQVCDVATCTCKCPPDCGGLAAGQVCDTATCQPRCQQAVTCAVGFKYDATACKCVCDASSLECGPGFVANASTCSCACQSNCGGCGTGETCDANTCTCGCSKTCPAGQVLDAAACTCGCNAAALACPSEKQADETTCSCVCKSDCGGCAKGFKCDTASCACQCNTAALKCGKTFQADPASCSCVCKDDCGGCGEDETCDRSTCSCVSGPT